MKLWKYYAVMAVLTKANVLCGIIGGGCFICALVGYKDDL